MNTMDLRRKRYERASAINNMGIMSAKELALLTDEDVYAIYEMYDYLLKPKNSKSPFCFLVDRLKNIGLVEKDQKAMTEEEEIILNTALLIKQKYG